MIKALVAAVALWAAAIGAHAMSILGDEISCAALARDMTIFTQMARDEQKLPIDEFLAIIEPQAREAMGLPGVYLRDKDDVDLAMGTLRRLWSSKLPAERVYSTVLTGCMKPVKLNGGGSVIHI